MLRCLGLISVYLFDMWQPTRCESRQLELLPRECVWPAATKALIFVLPTKSILHFNHLLISKYSITSLVGASRK